MFGRLMSKTLAVDNRFINEFIKIENHTVLEILSNVYFVIHKNKRKSFEMLTYIFM